jgi:dTDP-4-amino-4,6-dideoxygalactose transaminase
VFTDVIESTMLLDPQKVAANITQRTRAIVPVHLFGRRMAVSPLLELGVPIVEDAAQAFGAYHPAEPLGLGHFACWSFHPSKNLGLVGDGGLIATNDAAKAGTLRMRINHGRGPGGGHAIVGYNHRLDALQAAVGLVKLDRIRTWNARRVKHAMAYDHAFEGLDVVRPEVVDGHVFHQYAVHTVARDALIQHLANDGIAARIFYPRPVYHEPAFSALAPANPCVVAERVCGRVLCLPVHEQLTNVQQQKVVNSVRRFFGTQSPTEGVDDDDG